MGNSRKPVKPRRSANKLDVLEPNLRPTGSSAPRRKALIRVVVADDQDGVRRRTCELLKKHPEIQVVGDTCDFQRALELVKHHQPDVLITSVATPCFNGVELMDRIRGLGMKTRVVVLSAEADRALVKSALDRGANGYVLKCCLPDELLLAVHSAQRGDTYLSPEISDLAVERPAAKSELHPVQEITPREHEVLRLIVQGETNRSIARTLGISEKTVEKHRSSLMAKLNVHNMAGLICAAIKNRLVSV